MCQFRVEAVSHPKKTPRDDPGLVAGLHFAHYPTIFDEITLQSLMLRLHSTLYAIVFCTVLQHLQC